ncbi:PEP-CTERM sorting domain-containing protein [Phragmitibacter flavus]|uniref:PEP-CTERM sorting domain-containing protein n=1 Tax=Phragmitibacter flavus TaxID=2576071 RepID=A0A5R8KJK3_9BACT|nr:PEP-CTERM sorting domain-containing protein [Phragmitibacter flavus]TLD72494.1 PEP-CTERM sorting domain-containing protein [Phragmitibacter flavus]
MNAIKIPLVALLLSLAAPALHASVIAIYSFDAQNGNDASGNNNHATGSVTYSTSTPFGDGYAYSVNNNKLTAPHTTSSGSTTGFSDISNNLSVSFWINTGTTGNADWFRIARKGAGGTTSNHWIINRNAGTADTNIRIDSGETNPTGYNQNLAQNAQNVLTNDWRLVTYTLSYSTGTTGTWTEYLDGASVATGSFIFGNGLANTNALEIGVSGGNWIGLMDDLGIWSNALTAGEARSIYTLATNSLFNYDLELVTQLHTLHTTTTGTLDLNGYTWSYTDSLSGSGFNPGDLYFDSISSQWILQMTATTGLSAVPEPTRAVLLTLALGSLFLRRRRQRH